MMKHFGYILFIFALLFSIAPANDARADSPSVATSLLCPLPPPSSLTINAISTSSVSLQWPAVSGAASYKITMYDVTNSSYLTDALTTSTSYMYGGLTPGNSYIVGVSATACLYGQTGMEITAEFVTSIIIIDDLVEYNCNPLGSIMNPAGSYWVYLLPATSQSSTVQVKTIVASHGTLSVEAIKFNLWADCQYNIHYTPIDLLTGFLQNPSQDGSTTTVEVKHDETMSDPVYFTIANAATERVGQTLQAKVQISFGTYSSNLGNVRSCTFDEEYDCEGERPGQSDHVLIPQNAGDHLNNHAGASPERNELNASPNPFSDGFQISYVLEQESQVSLSLLDVNGKTVRNIRTDGLMAAGRYITAIEAEYLPAGVYFLVMQTDQTRQVVTVIKNP